MAGFVSNARLLVVFAVLQNFPTCKRYIIMTELNQFTAAKLLQLKAIKFQPSNPFTWGTGWLSPIYFDSRKILSYPNVRSVIKLELSRLIIEKYPAVECIASIAPNAIAIGMLVAEELGLPFVYVHPRPKDHGFENMIEGDLKPRQKVVIVEDQVSLGKNCLKVQDALKKNGCTVLGMASIFDYQLEEGVIALKNKELTNYPLTNFNSVLTAALETKALTENGAETVRKWQAAPADWKK